MMRAFIALTLSFLVTCSAYAQQAYLVEDLNTTYPAQVILQKNNHEPVVIGDYLYFITFILSTVSSDAYLNFQKGIPNI